MNRQVTYPSGFKCRKWTLVVLISIDLLVLIFTTVALINHQNDDVNPDDNRNSTSRIPTIDQLTNVARDVEDNLAKLNITYNINFSTLENNSTRKFLDGILNKAREDEGQTKWVSQILAIVIGFIICIIGLVGVLMEHYCLSMTYAGITFIGLLYTTLVGIYAQEAILVGKIIMYILFLILVVWYIIDLRSIRKQQKSQNI